MDEMELIRGFRSDLPPPDPDQVRAARTSLLEAIDEEKHARLRGRGSRLRIGGLRTAGVAIALAMVPTGFAIGQSLVTSAPAGVPASECPEANAVYERRGLPVPDEYAPACPRAEDVAARIERLTVPAPPAEVLKRQREGRLQESSGNLDQLPAFVREFRNGALPIPSLQSGRSDRK